MGNKKYYRKNYNNNNNKKNYYFKNKKYNHKDNNYQYDNSQFDVNRIEELVNNNLGDDKINNNEFKEEEFIPKKKDNHDFSLDDIQKDVYKLSKTESLGVDVNTDDLKDEIEVEIKKKPRKNLLIKTSFGYALGIIILLLAIVGTTYSYFNYTRESTQADIVTGNIYVKVVEDTVNLNNKLYPTTKEAARSKTDNVVTFTVKGLNTSDKTIYYEIKLNYGNSKTGTRFNDKDLVFDLIEVGENGTETYLLDAVSFLSVDGRRIWVDTVPHGTTTEVTKTYKLRMWLSDKVTIDDDNGTYPASTYKNYYASIKASVYGDMSLKSLPSSVKTSDTFVENGKSYFRVNLSNDYLLEDEGKLLDENDTVRIVVTNPENKLYFTYRDSEGNEELTQGESLDLTYTYNKNKTITMMVFTESKNDSNVSTSLNFEVYKNGTKVQEYTKQINVIGNNYCLNNGFTNLAECILVSDNLSQSKEEAITWINAKGTPDVNHTAPTYEYVELITENQTYTGNAGRPNWSSGAQYVFNSSTGTFALKQANGTTNASSSIALSDNLIGTYTCGTSNSGYETCGTIYKVTSVDTANNKITGTKITYKINSSMDSQVGLYKVVDNDGDSYIYRGAVSNNNVYFGGYYWKILRINGDGSIRLIFNGNTLASDGNKTAGNNAAISSTRATGINAEYPFNSNPGGPTYVGYMNTESDNYWTTGALASYSNFVENTAYYFADDFETYTDDYGNRQFKLKGNTYQSKVKDLTASQIEAHPYTCSGTKANLICSRLIKVDSRTNNTKVKGYYITYSPNYEENTSLTKADVEKNENDSTAKKQLDAWYETKFMNNQNNGKTITSYLIDNPFCNDRTINNTYTNGSYTLALSNSYTTGYSLTTNTYYQARRRLVDAVDPNKSATLLCNKNDNFSVTETANTNGKLDYPIGLITADEVAFAGGKYNEKNENFWLRTNGHFWTMSPSSFYSSNAYAYEFYVSPTGVMNYHYVTYGHGLRAVINISSNTQIRMGDGTPSNPYIID